MIVNLSDRYFKGDYLNLISLSLRSSFRVIFIENSDPDDETIR